MSSVMRNSWPKGIAKSEVISPETILRYQAHELAAATGGLLIGNVAKTTADDRIVLALEADSPDLETTVRFFEVQHQRSSDYPVLIVPPSPVPAYLRPRILRKGKGVLGAVSGIEQRMSDAAGTPDVWDNNKWLASDHVEFADKVEAVINSPEVKSILLSLMARAQKRQSEAATQPAEAQLS